MPSKGIDIFSWIALDGWTIDYTVPKGQAHHDGLHQWRRSHLEVDKKNLGLLDFAGDFQLNVKNPHGDVIVTKRVKVNSVTGSLEGGDLINLPGMKALVRDDSVITFGFYDSGPGIADLPKSHMCWVTVSPNWSRWMGDVASHGSRQAGKPFTTFVLPAAHDVGMNTMANVEALLRKAPDISPITGAIGSLPGVGDLLAKGDIAQIILALAITQKDTVTTMLQTGARYFEFRPAKMSTLFEKVNRMDDKLYFQHALIPGMAFDDFLRECVDFLKNNPSEIVCVQIRYDGVHESCPRPSEQDIDRYVEDALNARNHEIERGRFADLAQSIDTLRDQKKRLVVMNPLGQYSTYSDTANATLNGDSIAATFPGFIAGAAQQQNNQLFLWQCQATATNIRDVVIYSIVTSNDATSPILCTKPICDQVTLPWLQQHASAMPDTVLQAIMNDFFEGATADVAIQLSRGYLDR